MRKLGRTLKITTPKYFCYDDITLKLFVEISKTGDYSKLITSGDANDEELNNKWEDIVKKNGEANNDNSLNVYVNNFKRYGYFLAEHNEITILLTKLLIYVDRDIINLLRKKNIYIVTDSHGAFIESINNGFKKASNLLTKIRIEANKLALKTSNTQTGDVNLQELIAGISFALGFVISEDVKLAAYNEYKNLVKKKHDGSNRKIRPDK